MKKIYISLLMIIFTFSYPRCGKATVKNLNDYCGTRYPLVLVHGIGIRDDSRIVKYWGKIPDFLRKRGAVVILAHQEAFGSHRDNAEIIKRQINTLLERSPGYKKVNIIAHSKGGLESRYMISKLGMSHKVASLTTIATPHRGSAIADIVMGKIRSDRKFIVKFINRIARLLGDRKPDAYDAGYQLTSEYMKSFNEDVPDIETVYYQSYAAEIDGSYPNPFWRKMSEILYRHDGPNDSLVSIRSARWGKFMGVVKQEGRPLVSHADIVGLHLVTGVTGFREEIFFAEIVHGLIKSGF